MKPTFLLDSSACIPVLRNQAGLEKLPDPKLTGIPVIVAAELMRTGWDSSEHKAAGVVGERGEAESRQLDSHAFEQVTGGAVADGATDHGSIGGTRQGVPPPFG